MATHCLLEFVLGPNLPAELKAIFKYDGRSCFQSEYIKITLNYASHFPVLLMRAEFVDCGIVVSDR